VVFVVKILNSAVSKNFDLYLVVHHTSPPVTTIEQLKKIYNKQLSKICPKSIRKVENNK